MTNDVINVSAAKRFVELTPRNIREVLLQQTLPGNPTEDVGLSFRRRHAEYTCFDLEEFAKVFGTHGGRDEDSTGLQDSLNLGESATRIWYVIQHVVGDDEIERGTAERQRLYVDSYPRDVLEC